PGDGLAPSAFGKPFDAIAISYLVNKIATNAFAARRARRRPGHRVCPPPQGRILFDGPRKMIERRTMILFPGLKSFPPTAVGSSITRASELVTLRTFFEQICFLNLLPLYGWKNLFPYPGKQDLILC
ncbi:hypothetical protein DE146DRAFT_615969, partial [Phaeosphaeria sp. MPI-PUGE-AT-0046c]